jgi:polysaccharide export outer membrane protein
MRQAGVDLAHADFLRAAKDGFGGPSLCCGKRLLMLWMQRSLVLLAAVLLGAGSLWIPAERAFGQQVPTPSADQIEIFRNLTPDQQDAILRQMGGGGSGSGGGLGGLGGLGNSSGANDSSDRQNQRDRQRQGLGNDQDRTPSDEEQEPLIPVMKADDWVVVEIDFHLGPRPPSASPQMFSQGNPSSPSPQGPQPGGATGTPPQQQGNAMGNNPALAQSGAPPKTNQDLSDEEKKRLQGLIDLIRAKNPYQLSPDGVLSLPGFAGIALLGLTEDQASLRLRIEPAFEKLEIRITRLPLKKTGSQALKPFGYDLFERSPSTFAPVTNIPVPSDYTIGAGDELDLQLYGSQNRNLRLIVGRDGRVNLPELGPINVGGQLFSSAKATIEARIERQLIGVRGSVSMGDTRSIRVFVLGEAQRPGSYTISGLGTITSALFASGGVKRIGSLRKIQLKRQGTVVRQLDLYDLLIRGDTTDDAKLLQGDVIFIPPVGPTVSADGEVRRPAVYEIKNESTVADLVELAGGLTPQADTSNAMLTRIDEAQHRIVVPVSLAAAASKLQGLRNGDLIRVTRLRPTLDSGVAVEGHVYTQGNFAFRAGMRLSDVIRSVDDLLPNADLHYVLIRRELAPDRRITVLSADLAVALLAPGSKADLALQPRDRIMVFDLASGRDRVIQPVIDELRLQSNLARPTEVVHVDGRVKVPGEYPLESGMTVTDLVRAGGGLSDAAYGGNAELTRYRVVNGEVRRTELINIDLSAAMRGDPAGNVTLQPFDNLSIKEVSQWQGREGVTLAGEVRFPGHYSIKRGETLKSVVTRAGGLTEFAFPEGSVFTREELKKREQEQLDMLAERMQRDLTVLALEGTAANQGGAGAALSVGQTLLSQLRGAKAVGRLVIDLPHSLTAQPGSSQDVILRDGDQLIVPRFQQQVTVIGEVQNTTSHLFRAELARNDYIALSGGITRNGDRGRIYVVHANGSVVAGEGNRWFEGSQVPIKPGDTIVVPLNAERMPALPFWTAVTTIIYNVAIAAAAVHSF